MAKSKSKKIKKLRMYRDKLLLRLTNLEGSLREAIGVFELIRDALRNNDHIRAYALAEHPDGDFKMQGLTDFQDKNEIAKELALIYRFLSVEREYTRNISLALHNRDYLRALALAADHKAESMAHDKMLHDWSKDHGFTKNLRREANEDGIC